MIIPRVVRQASSIHQAYLPLVRILRAVEDGMDNDPLGFDLIEDRVGKSADEGTTVIEKDNRIHGRMSLNGQHRSFDATQKLQPQSWTLLIVPSNGAGDILPGLGEKMQLSTGEIQGSTS
jgi:hypothetical protein